MPLAPLAEVVEFLQAVDGHEFVADDASLAVEYAEDWERAAGADLHGLSVDAVAARKLYSMETQVYRELNRKLLEFYDKPILII